ncbi:MAG: flavodoxin family protein [Chloroflexi bacterium]|nr:flavodoxin family protein [Chloroflexota bacterium]
MATKRITMDAPEKVKILGISFSPRKEGITSAMVKQCLEWAESMGYAETEFISAADYNFYPCKGSSCLKCWGFKAPADAKQPQCYEHPDDGSNVLMPKTLEADGLLFGFPVHALGLSSLINIFLEKSHQISSPLAFTKWAGAWRYKALAVISQGMGDYTGQTVASARVGYQADMLNPGFSPTIDAPAPQNGSGFTSVAGMPVFDQFSYRKEATITVPPSSGSRNERAVKNMGRWLAVGAMYMKLAREGFKASGLNAPQPMPYTEYYIKPEPGSYVDKLVKEGKVKYVSENELRARVQVTA